MLAYNGYSFTENQLSIGRLNLNEVDPVTFYTDYVSKRKPCIISSIPLEIERYVQHWNNEYMMKKAGKCLVEVEYTSFSHNGINKKNVNFGLGKKKKMLFSDFLSEVERGNKFLYLTPQHAEESIAYDETHKHLRLSAYSPPLSLLLGGAQPFPSLLGNLLLHQVNLWMGCSPEGSNSGLHHDYHDNLYILLDGRKEFTLASPLDIPHVYTQGKLKKIFKNGRILYEGMSDVTEYEIENLYECATSETEKEQLDCLIEEKLDLLLQLQTKKKQKGLTSEKISSQLNKKLPENFSRVQAISKVAEKEFPLLSKIKFLKVLVNKNEMLYLPAGWIHNVKSFGKRHTAINYWCYPPDGDSFPQPYSDDVLIKYCKRKGS
ncbi:uncharacterized protein LOC135121845 isoform X2 [Zophobas morio]|uniref:uncharacterized protein LOC135121845 isoform X2 n=1 Tax=Zophobas morio TaxID=2755281 RepID=UPI0030838F2D